MPVASRERRPRAGGAWTVDVEELPAGGGEGDSLRTPLTRPGATAPRAPIRRPVRRRAAPSAADG